MDEYKDYTRDDTIYYCGKFFVDMKFSEEEIVNVISNKNSKNKKINPICGGLAHFSIIKYNITVEEIMRVVNIIKVYG